jgi:capsular polysaccharide biosynthesis protein
MLLDTTKRALTLRNAYVTRTDVDDQGRTFRGTVYDASGRLCELAQRPGARLLWRAADPARVIPHQDALQLDGRVASLGHYMTQYGHFILESLSRFWSLDDHGDFDWFVFQPFVHPLYAPEEFEPLRVALACFGVDPARIVFADRDLSIAELVVPMPLVAVYESIHRHQRRIYDRIARFCASALVDGEVPGDAERVYLSRRRYRNVVNRFRPPRREHLRERLLSRLLFNKRFEPLAPVINEDDVEALFVGRGFRVFHPEALSFVDQVNLYRGASVIAGFAGSALHNALFMREGGSALVLNTPSAFPDFHRNQALCAELAGVENLCIPFRGHTLSSDRVRVINLGMLQRSLDGMLASHVSRA